MAALVFVLVALALLASFIGLTKYETSRGARFFAIERARLDALVERAEFVLEHINLLVFLRDEVRHLISRLGHDIAHVFLVIVRVLERLLTRLVRRLRTSQEIDPAPRETAREFVKTLSEFKENLKGTHPDISDIQ